MSPLILDECMVSLIRLHMTSYARSRICARRRISVLISKGKIQLRLHRAPLGLRLVRQDFCWNFLYCLKRAWLAYVVDQCIICPRIQECRPILAAAPLMTHGSRGVEFFDMVELFDDIDLTYTFCWPIHLWWFLWTSQTALCLSCRYEYQSHRKTDLLVVHCDGQGACRRQRALPMLWTSKNFKDCLLLV